MAGLSRGRGPSQGHTEDMTHGLETEIMPLVRAAHVGRCAPGTSTIHSMAYCVRARRACRAPKSTHYTDGETEAWSRPVAKGQKSKLISPGLQSSPKHIGTALQCPTLCWRPRWGKEKGTCGPAKRSVGAAAREHGRRMVKMNPGYFCG